MKNIRLFLLLFLFSFSSLALAQDLTEHGPDLMKASFPIRYKFEQANHKEWQKATYEERKDFLAQWYKKEAEDAKKASIAAKEEAAAQREIDQAHREERKRLDNLRKASERLEKEEHKEKTDSRKDFDRIISQENKELERLQRSSSH